MKTISTSVKFLALLLAALIVLILAAFSGLNTFGQVTTGGAATHFPASSLHHTNFTISASPIVITGSSVTGVNGTYTLSSSNFANDLPLMIWTNGLNNGKIIFINDPGANIGGFSPVIETGSNDASFLYIGSLINDYIPAGPWAPNTAPGADVLVETLTTNAVVTTVGVAGATNLLSRGTNIWVDPINGNDTFASRTNRLPFRTIAAAYAVATNGDTIELATYTYTAGTPITSPVGVMLEGHGSAISNAFTFTDNCQVHGVRKFGSAPHFAMTNNVQCIFQFGVATGLSGDGIDIDAGAGLMQFWNMDNGSTWDACVMDNLSSNAVVEFYNCRMASVYDTGKAIVQGSHALTWYLNDTGGGKVRLYGGSLTVLNATNTVFSGTYGTNNSCLSIVNKNSHTNIGNASLELYGTVIAHGTTNAGVTVTAITNSLNVPIFGNYVDSRLGASLASPSITNTLVMLDPVSAPTLSVSGSGGISLATNSTAPNNTSTIRVWVSVTNGATVFKLPLYQ